LKSMELPALFEWFLSSGLHGDFVKREVVKLLSIPTRGLALNDSKCSLEYARY